MVKPMDHEIKIAIASSKHFKDKTLPIILTSLLQNDIKEEDIIIFISGYEANSESIENGVTYRQLDFNSFEYSPLIDITENDLESEYWFLIHDTCRVGNNFKNLLYNIPNDKPPKIALKECPSMSIGSYSYKYLKTEQDRLAAIKNKDYSPHSMSQWKIWGVPNEDYMLWKTPLDTLVYNENSTWDVVDYENWYGTNTIRRTEYYHSLDLYKNKSNWGQHPTSEMVLIV